MSRFKMQPSHLVRGRPLEWRGQAGFTLIELMITIAVLAVLLGIAAPSFQEMTFSSKLRTHANAVVASAVLARSEAIKRNKVITLCVSTDGASCTGGDWHQGWIVVDEDTDTVLHAEGAMASGFLASGSSASIDFEPSGVSAVSTSIRICRATPSEGSQERVVSISATGRTSVEKTTDGTCSSS